MRASRWAVAAGVLALLGALVFVVFFSPLLVLREVRVSGNHVLTERQVLDAVRPGYGTPLARLDVGLIDGRVRTLPAVLEARTEVRWPSALAVTITERTPVYARQDDGRFDWVDAHGVIFNTSSTVPDALPVATTKSTDARQLADLATVIAALPAVIAGQVEAIDQRSPDQMSLTLSGGRTLVWGSADQSELKGQVANALLKVKATVYDVSSPAHPTTR